MATVKINANNHQSKSTLGLSDDGYDLIEIAIKELRAGDSIVIQAWTEELEVFRDADGYAWRGLNGHMIGFPSLDRPGTVLKSFVEERVDGVRATVRRVDQWVDYLLRMS